MNDATILETEFNRERNNNTQTNKKTYISILSKIFSCQIDISASTGTMKWIVIKSQRNEKEKQKQFQFVIECALESLTENHIKKPLSRMGQGWERNWT